MTRTQLLAELEAAALEYGKAYAAYSAAFDRNQDFKRADTGLHPETEAACTATIAPNNRLLSAARALADFYATAETTPAVPLAVKGALDSASIPALVAFMLSRDEKAVSVQSVRESPDHPGRFLIDASDGIWLGRHTNSVAFIAGGSPPAPVGWSFERIGDPTEPTETTLAEESQPASNADATAFAGGAI